MNVTVSVFRSRSEAEFYENSSEPIVESPDCDLFRARNRESLAQLKRGAAALITGACRTNNHSLNFRPVSKSCGMRPSNAVPCRGGLSLEDACGHGFSRSTRHDDETCQDAVGVALSTHERGQREESRRYRHEASGSRANRPSCTYPRDGSSLHTVDEPRLSERNIVTKGQGNQGRLQRRVVARWTRGTPCSAKACQPDCETPSTGTRRLSAFVQREGYGYDTS